MITISFSTLTQYYVGIENVKDITSIFCTAPW